MLPSLNLVDTDTANWLLRGGDGNVRTALVCWTMVLGAFVILRIPREVILGCLIAAGATVGLAATVVEVAPKSHAAPLSAAGTPAVRGQIAPPAQGPAARLPTRDGAINRE
jgi:hypothetical protein